MSAPFRPVAVVLLAALPSSAVAWAYRKEGLEEPHVHFEVSAPWNWNYDQRVSVVSGPLVAAHHWASTVTLASGSL